MPIGALALIGLFFYALHGVEGDAGILSAAPATETRALNQGLTQIDSDSDGLYDWEEQLWGSDPKRKDTDSDGTTDGDEVTSGRNPTISGPDDTVREAPAPVYGSASSTENATLTNDAALQLFSGYLALRQEGDLAPEDVEQLVTGVINDTGGVLQAKQYTLSELTLLDSADRRTVTDYGAAIQAILTKAESVTENEFVVMQRMLTTGTDEGQTTLAHSSELYASLAAELLALPVPVAVQGEHLVLVNGYSELSRITSSMANFRNDIMATMLQMRAYAPTTNGMIAAWGRINVFVQSA